MVFQASFEPATLPEVVAAYQCVALELLRRPDRGREPSQALTRMFGIYIEPRGSGGAAGASASMDARR